MDTIGGFLEIVLQFEIQNFFKLVLRLGEKLLGQTNPEAKLCVRKMWERMTVKRAFNVLTFPSFFYADEIAWANYILIRNGVGYS